jgi:hypothetical protein
MGPVALRVQHGVSERPHYAYGVYSAADLAKRLGLSAISVIEFGVAGGRGLLALEAIAAEISAALEIAITVVGFDSGSGMPAAIDYRDLPYVWSPGFYAMDESKLRARLSPHTELVLGDVGDTVGAWLERKHAPVGFIAFDLDYYSSTKKAFRILETDTPQDRLPRVFCYFDDVIWPERACHSEFTGELCAIREFNDSHEALKLSPIHMLRDTRVNREFWCQQIYVLHDFKHPLYCQNVTPEGDEYRQIRI